MPQAQGTTLKERRTGALACKGVETWKRSRGSREAYPGTWGKRMWSPRQLR